MNCCTAEVESLLDTVVVSGGPVAFDALDVAALGCVLRLCGVEGITAAGVLARIDGRVQTYEW